MTTLSDIKESLEKTGKFYIAFVGDSITSCEWVHPNWRDIVTYVVQNEMSGVVKEWRTASWGVRGFNFGYDGATTKNILNKVSEILSIKPDLVIGIMGGNDPILGVSLKDSAHNLEKTVSAVIDSGSQVVWCTSPSSLDDKKNSRYEPYAFEAMKLDNRSNLQKINVFEMFKEYPLAKFYTFKSEAIPEDNILEGELDTAHPNQLGNANIAKIILKEVFGIEFDPEKYIKETLSGQKYPGY